MNIKKMKLPVIIIAIGLILAVASCFFTGIMKEPTIKEHEFDYSVTYSLDGEIKTYEGGFKCSFEGHDGHDDPTLREYVGVHTKNGNILNSISFTVAQKDGVELSIVADLDAAYLMGDPDKYEYVSGNEEPYLEAVDQEEYGVEVSDFFDAEIISWEYPEPIENSFEFVGFSRLYAVSMLVMLLVGVLTIIACVIFVKKNADVSYKLLDKLSIIAHFVIGIVVIPFITVVICLFPLVMDAGSLMYQIYLCIPPLTTFTVAASVALRRKGLTKPGLLVQFAFPVLFFAEIIVESIILNLFS
jgi:hypothetical protein